MYICICIYFPFPSFPSGFWDKAASLLNTIHPKEKNMSATSQEKLHDMMKLLAQHYETIMNYTEAERFYIFAMVPKEALAMYCRAGMWDAAQRLAKKTLTQEEAGRFYANQARELEKAGKLKDAERVCKGGVWG
jgi:intraflagellar transport protein 172